MVFSVWNAALLNKMKSFEAFTGFLPLYVLRAYEYVLEMYFPNQVLHAKMRNTAMSHIVVRIEILAFCK